MRNKTKGNNFSFKVIEKQNQTPNMKGYPVKRIAFHRKVGKKS